MNNKEESNDQFLERISKPLDDKEKSNMAKYFNNLGLEPPDSVNAPKQDDLDCDLLHNAMEQLKELYSGPNHAYSSFKDVPDIIFSSKKNGESSAMPTKQEMEQFNNILKKVIDSTRWGKSVVALQFKLLFDPNLEDGGIK